MIGLIVGGRYKIVGESVRGAQGFVCTVESVENGGLFALKSEKVEESERSDFDRIIENIKNLNKSRVKQYVITIVEHFYEGENAMIIMEFCPGHDLDSLIRSRTQEGKKFTEEEILLILFEGMSGLEGVHSKKMLHRDVKGSNLLFGADGKIKISDFSSSKILKRTMTRSLTGTLKYIAPEVANSEGYSYPADIFSFGVVLYEMMTLGKSPFCNQNGVVLADLLLGRYEPLSDLGYSRELRDLVHSCLSRDPSLRPTAARILSLPFVTRVRSFFTGGRTTPINIFVLGATGAGKSTFCNRLSMALGNADGSFVGSAGARSHTQNATGVLSGMFRIIDTPGLLDSGGADNDSISIQRMVTYAKELGYVNAFLLVQHAEMARIDDGIMRATKLYMESFGYDMLPRVGIVFTHGAFAKKDAMAYRAVEFAQMINEKCRTSQQGFPTWCVECCAEEKYGAMLPPKMVAKIDANTLEETDNILEWTKGQQDFSTTDAVFGTYEAEKRRVEAEKAKAVAQALQGEAERREQDEKRLREQAEVAQREEKRKREEAEKEKQEEKRKREEAEKEKQEEKQKREEAEKEKQTAVQKNRDAEKKLDKEKKKQLIKLGLVTVAGPIGAIASFFV